MSILPGMLIDSQQLQHWIHHFYGYGSWKAPIWFVAHEEEGGNLPGEVAAKLGYFFDKHPPGSSSELCDIRELYRNVPYNGDGPRAEIFAHLFDYRFGSKAVQHGIWKNLIAFVHGYRDRKVPDQLKYQKQSFCISSQADVAMLKLFPLPSPHNHGWYYSWLELPPKYMYLQHRATYEEYLFNTRIRSLIEKIREHRPEVVLMYGMSNINELKRAIQSAFSGVKFRITRAVKLKIPQYHSAEADGTTMLITTQIPALRHNRIESGFDWWTVGKSIAK